MKRVIPFNKFRYVAYTISLIIIVFGIGSTLLFRGYNVGVDFKGGLSQQLQIAPVAFRIANISNRVIDFEINQNEVSYIKSGDKKMVFPRPVNQPLADIVRNLESAGDLKVSIPAEAEFATSLLLPFHKQMDPGQDLVINRGLPAGAKLLASLDQVRALLAGIPGGLSIQALGDVNSQSFLIRSDPSSFKASGDADQSDVAAKTVIAAIEKQFGAGSVVEHARESLGPQVAQSLATGSLIAIAVALILMLGYVSIRFKINYATAAVIALIHDALTTLAFVGIFQVELNTAVVAALLTIIGYSINDTVVIYDRIRENEKLMKGSDLGIIMDTSVTQTLGRTFITSFTVFIAIFPLYLFGTGPVKDFSFAMIWGIITGAYSTVFIASPIALSWQRAVNNAKRKKEIQRFGQVQTPGLETEPSTVKPEFSVTDEAVETGATEEPGATGPAVKPESAPFTTTGTGPITRVQRVLEKKKKTRT
jgi:preprotein translocase subunit SecF